MRKTRIKQLSDERRNANANAALRLIENPSRLLATVQVGVTLAGFFASAIAAISAVDLLQSYLAELPIPFIQEASGPISIAVVTLAVAFLTLVFGELVPKNLAVTHSESISLLVAVPIEWAAKVFMPLVAFLTFTTNLILSVFGSRERAQLPEMTEEEIRSIIEAGEEEGVVEPMEYQMIESVFDFGETIVREIMVPRVDIASISRDAPVDEALSVFLRTGFSRLPVTDGSLDNIIGTVYAKDMLKIFGNWLKSTTVESIMRPVIFIPETKKLDELLRELQHRRTHLAIVVDQYGGTAGLVTLEDILEEIVGEIHDEYDTLEKQVERVAPNEVIVSGKVTLDELNDALGLELEGGGQYDTVGGLIYAHLGRIPNPGDRVVLAGIVFTVLSVQGRRIRQVRVLKLPVEGSSAA